MPIPTRLTAAAIACLGMTASAGVASAACPAAEPASAREITAHINQARTARGLAPLVPSRAITRPAVTHSTDMAVAQRLWHDDIRRWARRHSAAQNVGGGTSPVEVFGVMWRSAPHRRAIVSPRYARVGVSAVRACDGDLMVTVNFLS